ncbi:MAG TPA: cytochrome b/b6 domain-containing protein [Steroidobacteraceae bacterium]|nr:cytochrome b/b6 domain-containing protein [Steroidobacteraceae bacterium]
MRTIVTPRRSATVRLTHWMSAFGILALIVSGLAILFAHPRLYWGETGGVGTPALLDLPLPFKLGHSGWGRYLHFLAAWVCLASGIIYVIHSFSSGHFSRSLPSYNVVQRLSYLVVVFVLGPLVLLSGLAFSPALASVAPVIVNIFGGQQSARTIHFFVAAAIVIFLVGHVALAFKGGFRARMRAMITGREARST